MASYNDIVQKQDGRNGEESMETKQKNKEKGGTVVLSQKGKAPITA